MWPSRGLGCPSVLLVDTCLSHLTQVLDWRGRVLSDIIAERPELCGTSIPRTAGQVVVAGPYRPKEPQDLHTALYIWSRTLAASLLWWYSIALAHLLYHKSFLEA